MKTKLLTMIALCFCLAAVAHAQDLLNLTPAQERALQTHRDTVSTVMMLEMRLKTFFRSATVAGEEQAFLDAFGDKAADRIAWYKAARELVLTVKPTAQIPPVVDSVFVVKANGTVQFVAPPIVVTPPIVEEPLTPVVE